jgi:hypothetical protein
MKETNQDTLKYTSIKETQPKVNKILNFNILIFN